MTVPKKKFPPIHPGDSEILFLESFGIIQYRLAKDISVPPRRINERVKGVRSISANTALRFARYFSTSKRFWLNLQSQYDLECERDCLWRSLDDEVWKYANAGWDDKHIIAAEQTEHQSRDWCAS